jgi:outer membrane immunogenic protein
MKVRAALLGSLSVLAMAAVSQAADLPLKAGPARAVPYVPVASWSGFYVGLHAGYGRALHEQHYLTEIGGCYDTDFATCTITGSGGLAGLHAGYNWQSGVFVYGIEVDGTWTGIKETRFSTTSEATITVDVEWLVSFRGRMGLAMHDTMAYVTGGAALGGFNSGWCGPGGYCSKFSDVEWGFVVGAGIEHQFSRNWSIRGEFLYYGFPQASRADTNASGTYTTQFTHDIMVGRVGVSYKW